MEKKDMMNLIEVSLLIDWLKAHGHTEEETTDCIQFLAGKPAMDSSKLNKKQSDRNSDSKA